MLSLPAQFQVHEFTAQGKHILFDVQSLSFFETDELLPRIIALAKEHNQAEIVATLSVDYAPEQILRALQDIEARVAERTLTIDDGHDAHAQYLRDSPPPSTQLLVLDIAYGCNMQCDYCFGGPTASYADQPGPMSIEVIQRSVDYLLQNSVSNLPAHIAFFGGEPLLNWKGLEAAVRYADAEGLKHGRHVTYTAFTNGVLLNAERIRFLADHDISIMYSLDGPREVNDAIRHFRHGGGTYDVVRQNLELLLKAYQKPASPSQVFPPTIIVRATVTHNDLNLVELAQHFFDIGVNYLWLKPVTLLNHPLAITDEDVEILKAQETQLADLFLEKVIAGEPFVISTFMNKMLRLYRKYRRVRCFVGKYALGVSRFGEIYPCHRFVGRKKFYMGNVDQGIEGGHENPVWKRFLDYSVDSMPRCQQCWAKYICGGNCLNDNQIYQRDLYAPDVRRCELLLHESELAMALSLTLQAQYPSRFAKLAERYDSHAMQLMR